jgi:hypothetical protein
MNYYLNIFNAETWDLFRKSGASISGFRERQRKTAERIGPGDRFLCYLVGLGRWCGVLDIKSLVFIDSSPIYSDPDPFTMRFRVEPTVILDLDRSIPIREDGIWNILSITKDIEIGAPSWARIANLSNSLRQLNAQDGQFLSDLLLKQKAGQCPYPLSAQDHYRIGKKASIRTTDRDVLVEVPTDEPEETQAAEAEHPETVRDSYKIQAIVARIGAEMDFRIWIPRADRQKILGEISTKFHDKFLDALPLNYDDTTLRTIEQIDVIWLKGRSMSRAFEVEHTTAIYSGLLRMADLLALQPNMDIRLHIVAPSEKREKVLREIRRPVFSLLDRGPLYENCSYVSYEAIREIAEIKFLGHMNESILEEYEEFAQDE